MNRQILKLSSIAQKDTRLILGLMSGTSLDGLDIALCQVSGHGLATKLQLISFQTVPYRSEFRNLIRQIFAVREIDQQILSGLNALIAQTHADLVLRALKQWGMKSEDIDLIASHGQTVYHAPRILTGNPTLPDSTLQIGDGDHLAVLTGIITLADFRQKHVASGGQGAPLAIYGDYLLFGNTTNDRILLNIGGISNFSLVPSLQTEHKAYASDLGPGNTMMNQYMALHFQQEMDRDARIANQGTVNADLLHKLLADKFLSLPFPKTTGPELFNYVYLQKCLDQLEVDNISHQDVMATLNRFTAQTIIDGIQQISQTLSNFSIYVSGGGLHNPLLMKQLKDTFTDKVRPFDELGMNPDAKEACLFAVLANQAVAGNPEIFNNLALAPAVSMGKICLPY